MATIIAYGATASQTTSSQVLDCFDRCNIPALCNLLPQGAMWPRDTDTKLYDLCSALGIEYGRVDCQVAIMLQESYPDTAQQTLTHWEENCGIPDVCDGEVAGTIPERQDNVVECWRQDHVLNDAFWTTLAAKYGYPPPVITKAAAFCTGINCAGDPLCPLEAVLTVTFTFPSGADDELLECKLRKLWPPYSPLIVVFT